MRDDSPKVPIEHILEKKLIEAHKRIAHLEKQYKIKEVEALLKKQHDELIHLRTENTHLKNQNAHMKKQIERLSTLVYSAVPKIQRAEFQPQPTTKKDRKP